MKSKSRIIAAAIMLVIILLVSCGGILWYFYSMYINISYQTPSYSDVYDSQSKQPTGWYYIYPYLLTDDSTYNYINIRKSYEYDTDTTMTLLEFNLKEYRDGDISEYALKQLRDVLAETVLIKDKLIVRFLYDWDGNAKVTEPDDINIILRHIEQVAPIVNSFKGNIYTLQGIFIGNHGEMHNTKFSTLNEQKQLLEKMNEEFDSSIYMAVRTPKQLRTLTGCDDPLTDSNAFSDSLLSRVGLFNDGMLGSSSDLGSYIERSRNEELDFQEQICNFVPNGGEAVIDNTYNDLDNAISDLKRMHVSYLNCAYDENVINKWKNSTYTSDDPNDVFNGVSGYDYIGAHLGFRYYIKESHIEFNTYKDRNANLVFTIENSGFAPSYKEFNVNVIITNNNTGKKDTIACSTDTRYWKAGEATSVTVPFNIRDYKEGTYSITLSIIDPSSNKTIALSGADEIATITLSKYKR